MIITINCRNVKPGEKLEAAIRSKISKLDKYFSQDAEAIVLLSEERQGLAKLETTIHAGKLTFRAEEKNSDLFFCLDRVMDKLSSQMSRQKGKLEKRHKDAKEILVSAIPDAPSIVDEGLVRIKHLEITRMDTDEAILQMELLGHSFFVYEDEADKCISVLYKRANGGYGVLKTK